MELALLLTGCPIGYLVTVRGSYGLYKWRNMFHREDCCKDHPDGEERTEHTRLFCAFVWPVMLCAAFFVVTGKVVLHFIRSGW